jgi:uncharacterized membrane protein YqaE (UPF0057 family)
MLRYLLAIFLPPIAMIVEGRMGHLLLNIVLCLLGYLPGVIHAVLVVADGNAKKAEAIRKAEIKEIVGAIAQKNTTESRESSSFKPMLSGKLEISPEEYLPKLSSVVDELSRLNREGITGKKAVDRLSPELRRALNLKLVLPLQIVFATLTVYILGAYVLELF